jgi:hypothetical protein
MMSEATESATIQPINDMVEIADPLKLPETVPPVQADGIEDNHYHSDNPLYDRLYRLTKPHRWWVVVTVSLGLFVGAGQNFPSFLNLLDNSSTTMGPFLVSLILLFYVGSLVAAIGLFLTPILIAAMAASLTAHETTADSYELVLLTDLTNSQIVRAYLRIGIQRTQVLWAFYVAVTLPALIAFFISPQTDYYGITYRSQGLITLLVRVPWLILALVWGVWVAQRIRRPSGAITGAVFGMFVAQLIYSAVSSVLFLVTVVNYDNQNYVGSTNPYSLALSGQELGYILLSIVCALVIPLLAGILYATLPARVPRRV